MNTVFQQPAGLVTEGAKARWWRQRIMNMTRIQLSLATGYSMDAIRLFELDRTSRGSVPTKQAWQRFRLACAGMQSDPTFNWEGPSA